MTAGDRSEPPAQRREGQSCGGKGQACEGSGASAPTALKRLHVQRDRLRDGRERFESVEHAKGFEVGPVVGVGARGRRRMVGSREVVVDGVGEGRQGPRGGASYRRRLRSGLWEAPLACAMTWGCPGGFHRCFFCSANRTLPCSRTSVLEHETAFSANITSSGGRARPARTGRGRQHLSPPPRFP